MSTLAAGYTMMEMAKQISPTGTQMTIANILARKMAILLDIKWYPSNDIWSHKSLRSAKLSGGTWRGLNEYVTPGTTLTDEILDVIGIIEDFQTYDKLWIERQPDPDMARMSRAKLCLEGISQTLVSAFLYSNNKVSPKQPHGLMPRTNTLGRYVVNNGGTGSDLASVLVVTHGDGGVYGIFPRTGAAPEGEFLVQHRNMGERVDTNSSGQKLIVLEDNFKFEGGLVVEDPACLGRLANIETAGVSNTFDEDNLITLVGRMNINENSVVYCNEAVLTQMRIRMKDKTNLYFTPGKGTGLFGEPVLYFDSIPIRKIDSAIMVNTEDTVV